MCLHDAVQEAGKEEFTFWQGDEYRHIEFDLVQCEDCGSTFLLDELHDLG